MNITITRTVSNSTGAVTHTAEMDCSDLDPRGIPMAYATQPDDKALERGLQEKIGQRIAALFKSLP